MARQAPNNALEHSITHEIDALPLPSPQIRGVNHSTRAREGMRGSVQRQSIVLARALSGLL